ncbi:MAG: anti-sigma factor antagonist [Acutalibacteraceae bacterium]
MECEITISGSVMKAALSGEIDHHSVRDVRERIDMELDINRPKTLFLDFGKITFMDSSGIGLVLGRCRKTQLYGGKVEILNPSPQIKKVMKLSGLEQLAVIDAKSNDKDGANNEG